MVFSKFLFHFIFHEQMVMIVYHSPARVGKRLHVNDLTQLVLHEALNEGVPLLFYHLFLSGSGTVALML